MQVYLWLQLWTHTVGCTSHEKSFRDKSASTSGHTVSRMCHQCCGARKVQQRGAQNEGAGTSIKDFLSESSEMACINSHRSAPFHKPWSTLLKLFGNSDSERFSTCYSLFKHPNTGGCNADLRTSILTSEQRFYEPGLLTLCTVQTTKSGNVLQVHVPYESTSPCWFKDPWMIKFAWRVQQ